MCTTADVEMKRQHRLHCFFLVPLGAWVGPRPVLVATQHQSHAWHHYQGTRHLVWASDDLNGACTAVELTCSDPRWVFLIFCMNCSLNDPLAVLLHDGPCWPTGRAGRVQQP